MTLKRVEETTYTSQHDADVRRARAKRQHEQRTSTPEKRAKLNKYYRDLREGRRAESGAYLNNLAKRETNA
jgi:hypothetical protein